MSRDRSAHVGTATLDRDAEVRGRVVGEVRGDEAGAGIDALTQK